METLQVTTDSEKPNRLVDAQGLLEQLFQPESRPSLAWVRRQTRARSIPAIRLGRLVFYDPPAVREKLARKNTEEIGRSVLEFFHQDALGGFAERHHHDDRHDADDDAEQGEACAQTMREQRKPGHPRRFDETRPKRGEAE